MQPRYSDRSLCGVGFASLSLVLLSSMDTQAPPQRVTLVAVVPVWGHFSWGCEGSLVTLDHQAPELSEAHPPPGMLQAAAGQQVTAPAGPSLASAGPPPHALLLGNPPAEGGLHRLKTSFPREPLPCPHPCAGSILVSIELGAASPAEHSLTPGPGARSGGSRAAVGREDPRALGEWGVEVGQQHLPGQTSGSRQGRGLGHLCRGLRCPGCEVACAQPCRWSQVAEPGGGER